MTRLAVFVNPRSGSGRAGKMWEALRAADAQLAAARLVSADGAVEARDKLRRVLDEGVDRVLVFGGDGTAHLVANVLLDRGVGARVALGLVPAGTGSDLARALRLPRTPKAAVARALSAPGRMLDVLQIRADDGRARWVVNTASAGISGLVVEAVNALPKRGTLSYLGATLGAVARYRDVSCRVTVDGTVWHEGPLLLVAVVNGPNFGNGMRVAPDAKPDDGRADVVLVRPVPRWQLPLRLPQIYLGTHVHAPFVRVGTATAVRWDPLAPMRSFELDGEAFPAGPATLTVVPRALLVAA